MSDALPDWFAADQVFASQDGWYVGVTNGYRIGPFAQQSQAEQHSRELTAQLQNCSDTRGRVRIVRRFVIEQTGAHGRVVRSDLADADSAPERMPAPVVRAGERPRVWFRTNRVYAVGEVWFFSTREGIDIGPYATRQEAEQDLQCLIDILRRTRDPNRNLAAIRRFQEGLEAAARS